MSRFCGDMWSGMLGCLLLGVLSLPVGAEDHSPTPAAGEHHGEVAHPEGVPMNFKGDLALWSLVTFVVFFTVLSKVAWGPLQDGLNQREANIRKEIAEAQASNQEAAALLQEHDAKLAAVQEEVKAILAEARRDAERNKQDITAAAQQEAEATRKRAVEDIERAKAAAIGELFDFVSHNVVKATEQVLSRSLTGDDQERLVSQALSEMNLRRN